MHKNYIRTNNSQKPSSLLLKELPIYSYQIKFSLTEKITRIPTIPGLATLQRYSKVGLIWGFSLPGTNQVLKNTLQVTSVR